MGRSSKSSKSKSAKKRTKRTPAPPQESGVVSVEPRTGVVVDPQTLEPASTLPEWQERFCWRYASTLNATQSYILARPGFEVQRNTAWTESYRLLRQPEIKARVAEIQKQLCDEAQVESGVIVREMKRLAFARLSDVIEWKHDESGRHLQIKVVASADLDDDTLSAVAEISRDDTEHGEKFRVKMHDKTGPLLHLAKIRGLMVEKHELTGKVSYEEIIARSREK